VSTKEQDRGGPEWPVVDSLLRNWSAEADVARELASRTPPAVKHSFWTSAPNLLKGLAGLLTAVAALMVPLHQIGAFGSKEQSVQTTVTEKAAARPTPPAPAPARPAAPSVAPLRTFVDGLDVLLTNSGRTRGDLNAVLTGVRNGTVSQRLAFVRLEAVLDNRNDLLNAVSTKETPAEFARTRRLLVDAVDLSIRVDRAALAFAEAWFAGNEAASTTAFREIVSGSTLATAKKTEFASEYNRVRAVHGLGTFSGDV
jgi:hypothetical protein